MLEEGVITQAQADQSRAAHLDLQKAPTTLENPALAFTTLVENDVARLVGRPRLERGGLVIRTTLDYDLQLQLECTLQTQLARVSSKSQDTIIPSVGSESAGSCAAARLLPTLSFEGQANLEYLAASGLVLDPQTGQVLAMVGDLTLAGQESPAMSAHPTGSLLTPFIYLAGFTRGMSPGTLVWDIPSSLPPTMSDKVNPGGQFHGPVRLRIALANDYLAPAAQLLAQISPDVVWNSAAAFGLPSLSGENVPFSGGALTTIEVAQAYGVLANQGLMAGQVLDSESSLQPAALLQIQDSSGTSLLDWTDPMERSIISAPLAYLVDQSLSDETARWPSLGSSNPLGIGRQAAAKLGQTSDGRDSWVVGYTPQQVSVLWMGFNQPVSQISGQEGAEAGGSESESPMPTLDGSQRLDVRWVAGMWHAIMQYAVNSQPAIGWTPPPGISTMEVCDPSGLLPTPACPNVVSEVFLSGNEPTTADNLYQTFEIDHETGLLATVFTPPALVVDQTYLVVPSEARQWAAASGLPVPPDQYDVIQAPVSLPDIHITSPAIFGNVRGQVEIAGTAAGDQLASYQVQVGQGLNPQEWIQIGAGDKPIEEGMLASWDTTGENDGLYAVQLTVVDKDQQVKTAIIQVTVDNTPPLVSLSYPVAGQVFTYKSGFSVTFQASASDDINLTRVEWWVDGKLVSETSQPPFSFPWQAIPGNHTLVVKGYDQAGNVSQTDPLKFIIR